MLSRRNNVGESATELKNLYQTARKRIPDGIIVLAAVAAQLQRDIKQLGQTPPAYSPVLDMREMPQMHSDNDSVIERSDNQDGNHLSELEREQLEIEGLALLEDTQPMKVVKLEEKGRLR